VDYGGGGGRNRTIRKEADGGEGRGGERREGGEE
jgi:hypothetical protein